MGSFLMKKNLWMICCVFAFAMTLSADVTVSKVFEAASCGSFKVGSLEFKATAWAPNWYSAVQRANSVSLEKGYPKFTDGSFLTQGVFRVNNGRFNLAESIRSTGAYQAEYSIRLNSAETIQCAELALEAVLPIKRFRGRPIYFDGKLANFGAEFDEKNNSFNGQVKKIEIALEGGILTLSGIFNVRLQDNRRYNSDEWALRIRLKPASGAIKDASLTMQMTYAPAASTTVSIAKASNMGFADEVENDGKGGWTDQGSENDLRSFPVKATTFAGIPFAITDPAKNNNKSCIVLRGRERPNFPVSAEVVLEKPVKGKYLYVLNALGWEPSGRTEIGEITIDFDNNMFVDKSVKSYPVKSGINTANFWMPRLISEATVGWRHENPSSTIGLYVSRFELPPEAVKKITFESKNNAVWMIAGVTISDAASSVETSQPVVMRASKDWLPATNKKEIIRGSILDFSDLQEAPAGKFGFAKAKGDHIEFEKRPGVNARFYGANIAFAPNFMEKKYMDRMANEFATTGYNIIRLHHFDGKVVKRTERNSTELDPKWIDRMDYLISACKERGIYTTLDLFILRTLQKGEIEAFPDQAIAPMEFKSLMFVNAQAMDNWKRFSANLLNHVNPYTGKAWKDEPAIVTISLINENTVFSTVPRFPFILKIYEEKFAVWAKERSLKITGENREHYWKNFLSETYRRGFSEMRDFLNQQGVKQLITDQNYWGNVATTLLRNDYDFVDNHFYWGHPVFLGKNWSLPMAISNDSAIPRYAGGVSGMFPTRIFGKPFSVTEWDYVNPNSYNVEGAFLMGAYSALQDWNVLCRFAYSHGDGRIMKEESTIGTFDIANDPLRLLSERAGILFFLRNDVRVAQTSYPIMVSTTHIQKQGFSDNYPALTYRIGLIGKTGTVLTEPGKEPKLPKNSLAALAFPGDVWKLSIPVIPMAGTNQALESLEKGKLIPADSYEASSGNFRSDTGELALDRKNGAFSVITAKSEAFVLPAGKSGTGNFVTVKNLDTFAAFLIAARDDKNLSSSGRILILHLTDTKNTMQKFRNAEMTIVDSWGTLPLLIRRGRAELELRGNFANYKLYALDFNGKRLFEVPFKAEASCAKLKLDTQQNRQVVAAYELSK